MTFAGVPILVSPHMAKGTAYFMPSDLTDLGNPVIVTDHVNTVFELIDRWFAAQDKEFFRQCGVIFNLKEDF